MSGPTVHMLVRNDAHWIWFSVQSALGGGGRVLVWDTGSTDGTPEIIQRIEDPRIELRRIGAVHPADLVELRNEMIRSTRRTWFVLIDGDEVWPATLWPAARAHFVDPACDTLVVPVYLPFPRLGWHHANPTREPFRIAGREGAWAARAFRPQGARWQGRWGEEVLVGHDGCLRTAGDHPGMRTVDCAYWHMTLLPRSPHDAATPWRHAKIQVEDPTDVLLARAPHIPSLFCAIRPEGVADPFAHVSPAMPPVHIPERPC